MNRRKENKKQIKCYACIVFRFIVYRIQMTILLCVVVCIELSQHTHIQFRIMHIPTHNIIHTAPAHIHILVDLENDRNFCFVTAECVPCYKIKEQIHACHMVMGDANKRTTTAKRVKELRTYNREK